MNSLVEMCVAFRPGILDEYDKETRDIVTELKGLLQHEQGVAPDVAGSSNVNRLGTLGCSSGPGPPISDRGSRSNAVTMETMMNTLMARNSFSENYIGAMRSDVKAIEGASLISKPNKINRQRGVKQKRRLGTTMRSSRSETSPGTMADMTGSHSDGGSLSVTTEDGSIKKFSILPPIESSDQVTPAMESSQEGTVKENTTQGDLDYNEPSKYGWHVSSMEKWSSYDENTGNTPASKDMKSHPSGDKLGPLTNLKLPLRPSVPNSTSYGTNKSTTDHQLVSQSLPDAGSLSNSYVAMSVMTSGQEELKRHLKQRQQQRESDQKDFKAESVNGKPMNSTGTYLIKYGNVEVPTTDVELYAILSVEKHNSPFATEFDGMQPESDSKAITDRIEEKLDSLVERERLEGRDVYQFSNEKELVKENEDHAPNSDEPNSALRERKSYSEVQERSDLPFVHTSKPVIKGVPKLGYLIGTDTRTKRKLKQGQLYKCYDTTKPSLRAKPQMDPSTLKPLVSTAPVEIVKITKSQEHDIQQEEPAFELNEDGSRVERRNISVTLPTVTCEYEEETSQTTSQYGGSQYEESPPQPNKIPAPVPTNRLPYSPPKVTLGNAKNATPISEIPSSASSRSSTGSSSSRNSARYARHSHDDENRKERKPPDEVDIEMNEKMLSVMGSNITRRGPSGGNNTNTNSSNLARTRHSSEHSTNSPEYSRRVAAPRMGVPLRRNQADDIYESMSVSMISVSSDPIDSRNSSAHRRVSPGADQTPYSGLTSHAVSSERLAVSNSRVRTTSVSSAVRGVAGSLPELHPVSGVSAAKITGDKMQVVAVASAKGQQKPNSGSKAQRQGISNVKVTVPKTQITPHTDMRNSDQRS